MGDKPRRTSNGLLMDCEGHEKKKTKTPTLLSSTKLGHMNVCVSLNCLPKEDKNRLPVIIKTYSKKYGYKSEQINKNQVPNFDVTILRVGGGELVRSRLRV